MKIAATSDMHGLLERAPFFPEADVLILAGDLVENYAHERQDVIPQRFALQALDRFIAALPYKYRIVVAGNHDWALFFDDGHKIFDSAIYLQDEEVILDGVRFYGMPWVPNYYNWAFMYPESDPEEGYPEARDTCMDIPAGIDVLITHGPPLGILDRTRSGRLAGCPVLAEHVLQRVKPKLHVFGHIHEGYGMLNMASTTFANVALCDRDYEPKNPIQVFTV
jgi:Icc-related predicted phosphoesterase